MEKLILSAVVILGLTFSYNALSYQSQTTCADASTCKTTPGPGGSLGAFIPGPSPGMAGASVGLSPEKRAEINKKIAADQAAYCKANNYPTHVPFCAGYKQQAIES